MIFPENEKQKSPPLVSALVSVYNGEKFIRGLLEDLCSQSLGERLEVIVIDSASPGGEAELISDCKRSLEKRKRQGENLPSLRYVRTPQRETIYAAWNRGIQLARGRYITNANVDDRHHPEALEKLSSVAEAHPDVALVYADSAVTESPNGVFGSAPLVGHFRWPGFDVRTLFGVCCVGPQPLWRRDLHKKYGLFRADYRSGGDYEFWLRISLKEKFLHVPEVLGLYLRNPGGVELSDPELSQTECRQARQDHWPKENGPIPKADKGYFVPLSEDCSVSERSL